MEGCSSKDGACPQLLDLIPKDREKEWIVQKEHEERRSSLGPSSEEKKLELRLGLPGEEEDWRVKYEGSKNKNPIANNNTSGAKRVFTETEIDMKAAEINGWVKSKNGSQNQNQNHNFSFASSPSPWHPNPPFLQLQSSPKSFPVMAKESSHSQPCCTKGVVDLQGAEKKEVFSSLSPPANNHNTAVPNSSQKRRSAAAAVGWPPIRSFRKNLASSSSSKPVPEPQNLSPVKVLGEKQVENCKNGFFVKINMDGIPIGRKVDLKTYDSYEKLSSAVDELFRGLLAVQTDSSAGGIQDKEEGEKAITGLLDGTGEYTLVYEDNEGDRVLVGDVPWHMFVSTVKRLRVLKSSELSTMRLGSKQTKMSPNAAL